jgi:hypothetical protein
MPRARPLDDRLPLGDRLSAAAEPFEQEGAPVAPADRLAVGRKGALPGRERLLLAARPRQQLRPLLEHEHVVGRPRDRRLRLRPPPVRDVRLREAAQRDRVVAAAVARDRVVSLAEHRQRVNELVVVLRVGRVCLDRLLVAEHRRA